MATPGGPPAPAEKATAPPPERIGAPPVRGRAFVLPPPGAVPVLRQTRGPGVPNDARPASAGGPPPHNPPPSPNQPNTQPLAPQVSPRNVSSPNPGAASFPGARSGPPRGPPAFLRPGPTPPSGGAASPIHPGASPSSSYGQLTPQPVPPVLTVPDASTSDTAPPATPPPATPPPSAPPPSTPPPATPLKRATFSTPQPQQNVLSASSPALPVAAGAAGTPPGTPTRTQKRNSVSSVILPMAYNNNNSKPHGSPARSSSGLHIIGPADNLLSTKAPLHNVYNPKTPHGVGALHPKYSYLIERRAASPRQGEEAVRLHPTTFVRILDDLVESALSEEERQLPSVQEALSALEVKINAAVYKNTRASKTTLNALWRVVQDASMYFAYERELAAIILIQSKWRGYRARKFFHNTLKFYLQPSIKTRNNVFRELRKSEGNVISKLEVVVGGYYLPLKELANGHKPIISSKDIVTVFGNIETVLNFHRKLKEGFDKLRSDAWPMVDTIGDVFLKLAPELKHYGTYVENFDAAINHIKFLQQISDKKFNQFLNEVFEKTNFGGMKIGLFELLSTPLNQMNEYEQKLEALVNYTPANHPGLDSVVKAAALMKETSAYVREAMAESQHRAQLLTVQRNLADEYEVIKTKRRFESEFDTKHVTIGSKKNKKAHIFVFNDVLLITQKGSKNYKVLEEVQLAGEIIPVVEDILATAGKSGKKKNEFAINTPKQRYVIGVETPEEKQALFKEVSRVVEFHNNKTKVFKVPFTMVIARDKCANGIPLVVEKICNFLRGKLELDGIFRISAKVNEVNELMTAIDKGLYDAANWGTVNPYALAALLKMYFRELPDPLFPFECYDPIIAAADIMDESARLEKVKEIIGRLPAANLTLLRYIVHFLFDVAQHADVNRMNASNLAIVFGPNLIRPKVETMESSINVPKTNIVLEDIIKSKHKVFAE